MSRSADSARPGKGGQNHLRVVARIALQLAVSAAFIAFLLWRVDVGKLGRELAGVQMRWLLLAAPCFAASAVFGGLRWWVLAREAGRIPLRDGVLTLLATSAADLVLPLRAGTVALFQVLYRRYGVPRAAVIGTAAAGGLVDIVTTILLVLVVSPLLAAGHSTAFGVLLGVAAGVAGVAIAMLLVLRGVGVRRLLSCVPGGLCERIARQADYLLSGFAALTDVRTAVPLVLLTLADWGAAAVGYIVVGHAFQLNVGWPAFLLVESVGNLAGLVPLTEGNIGTYEVFVREMLAAAGAQGAAAAAFAVGAHAVSLATTLVLAVASAVAVRLRPRDLFYRDADVPDATAPPSTMQPRP